MPLLPSPALISQEQQMQPYYQPPPLFVPPVLHFAVEPTVAVRPGPNAQKKLASPEQRFRKNSTSGSNDISAESDKAQRKAFYAKRFHHAELRTDKDGDKPRNIREEDALKKTRKHIAVVDSELSNVDADIARLQTKREELIKQKNSLVDILTTMVGYEEETHEPEPQQDRSRNEIQCPEVVSTEQVANIEMHSEPTELVPMKQEKRTIPSRNSKSTEQNVDNSSRKRKSSNLEGERVSTNSRSITPSRRPTTPIEQPQQPPQQPQQQQQKQKQKPPEPQGLLMVFRDVKSGSKCSRGIDDDALIVTCFACVGGDPELALLGFKSGHVAKYSLHSQEVTRKEFIFRKSVTALCAVVPTDSGADDLRIFAGSSDGDYRCYNGTLSEAIHSNRFGWGVCCIKYLLNHVYIGIGVSISFTSHC